MITAFHLMGFFAAHAVWGLSDGEGFAPMFAYAGDDERKLVRLAGNDAGRAVLEGRAMLEANGVDADDAVLLYDGRIPLNGQKYDAIIAEVRCYAWPDARAVMAIPYKPSDTGDFRVYRPKLQQWEGCDDFDMNAAVDAFFAGVDSHEKGAAVWNARLDQSL